MLPPSKQPTVASLQGHDSLRWDDVRVFLALAREQSLGRAATRLGLDTSTASRRLAALEETLGTRLFDRTRDGLVLTAAAEQLVPAAEETEKGAQHFANAVGAIEATVEGVVRMSAAPGVAADFVAPALARLLDRHPQLRIELDARIQVTDLTRQEADLAIRGIRPQSGDLVMTRLLESRYVVLASPAYVTAMGTIKDWNDLRWISWGADLAHIPSSQWLSQRLTRTRPALMTTSISAQIAAAQSGFGAVLMPEIYVSKKLVRVAMSRSLREQTEFPTDVLWLVGHRALRNVPRVAAVWDFVVDEAARITSGAK